MAANAMTYKDGTDQHYDGNIVYISAETIGSFLER
jgi:hypothetical protein